MNLQQYWAIIEEWRKLYGTSPPISPTNYNPTNVKLGCKKCGKIKTKMQRHHKANDFFFAMAMPHIFAARYILFHPDDVDLLCANCHKGWHRYVEPKLVDMYAQYNVMPTKPDKEWCEDWKIQISKWYSKWINKPLKRKKRRKRAQTGK